MKLSKTAMVEVGSRSTFFDERYADLQATIVDVDLSQRDGARLTRLERRLERLEERSPGEMTAKEERLWGKIGDILDKYDLPALDDLVDTGDEKRMALIEGDQMMTIMPVEPWGVTPEILTIWAEMDAIWAKYPQPEPSAADQARLDELSRQIDGLVADNRADLDDELQPIWNEIDQIWSDYQAPAPSAEDQARLDQLSGELDQLWVDLYKPSDEQQAIFDQIDAIWARYPAPEPSPEDQARLDELYGKVGAIELGPDGEAPDEAVALWAEIDTLWAQYQAPEPTAEDQAQLQELYHQMGGFFYCGTGLLMAAERGQVIGAESILPVEADILGPPVAIEDPSVDGGIGSGADPFAIYPAGTPMKDPLDILIAA